MFDKKIAVKYIVRATKKTLLASSNLITHLAIWHNVWRHTKLLYGWKLVGFTEAEPWMVSNWISYLSKRWFPKIISRPSIPVRTKQLMFVLRWDFGRCLAKKDTKKLLGLDTYLQASSKSCAFRCVAENVIVKMKDSFEPTNMRIKQIIITDQMQDTG